MRTNPVMDRPTTPGHHLTIRPLREVANLHTDRMTRPWVAAGLAAALVPSACSNDDRGEVDQRRSPSLSTYEAESGAVHVADFNDQVGPGSKTVTIPSSSERILVRFDCLGPGESYRISISGDGFGGSTCDAIREFGGVPYGSSDVKRGQRFTIKVKVAESVRWSASIDLPESEAASDRLVNTRSSSWTSSTPQAGYHHGPKESPEQRSSSLERERFTVVAQLQKLLDARHSRRISVPGGSTSTPATRRAASSHPRLVSPTRSGARTSGSDAEQRRTIRPPR